MQIQIMDEVISMSILQESEQIEDKLMKKIRSRSGKIFKIVDSNLNGNLKEYIPNQNQILVL